MTQIKLVLYLGILLFVFPRPVFAYLDPGTGSYLFQIFIASLLGGTFFMKNALGKVKNFFKSKEGDKNLKNGDDD